MTQKSGGWELTLRSLGSHSCGGGHLLFNKTWLLTIATTIEDSTCAVSEIQCFNKEIIAVKNEQTQKHTFTIS